MLFAIDFLRRLWVYGPKAFFQISEPYAVCNRLSTTTLGLWSKSFFLNIGALCCLQSTFYDDFA